PRTANQRIRASPRTATGERRTANAECDNPPMFDVAIVGGGIVGLTSAWALSAEGQRVVVLEKERDVALHQSGRNSGVLHSGIYYKPGSLKAELCREGRAAMAAFCRDEALP